jgi:DNA gyrase/topoisomerase IV subunit B
VSQLRTSRLKANLKLSDVQYAKVYAANTEFLKQAKVIRNSADDSSVKSQKQKDLGNQRDAALKQILTADQYTTYLNNREQAKKDIKKVIEDRKKAESKRSGLKPAKQ